MTRPGAFALLTSLFESSDLGLDAVVNVCAGTLGSWHFHSGSRILTQRACLAGGDEEDFHRPNVVSDELRVCCPGGMSLR